MLGVLRFYTQKTDNYPQPWYEHFMLLKFIWEFNYCFSYRDKRDIDCDIRENIINYEDEGGGEGDQTGYDLSVLRMMSDGTPALHAGQPNKMMKFSPHDAPDIQTFLQTNKVMESILCSN